MLRQSLFMPKTHPNFLFSSKWPNTLSHFNYTNTMSNLFQLGHIVPTQPTPPSGISHREVHIFGQLRFLQLATNGDIFFLTFDLPMFGHVFLLQRFLWGCFRIGWGHPVGYRLKLGKRVVNHQLWLCFQKNRFLRAQSHTHPLLST